jgi:proteasome lid subunit RPN8/RPN11
MYDITVRFSQPLWDDLCNHLFSRYPDNEWATWINFGWRATADSLVLTAAMLDLPQTGELDESVPNVAIQETYSLRVALQAEKHPFAVGVVHSHPKDCLPIASLVDDDMDRYYADYLSGFTGDRPYPSLIVSEIAGDIVAGGRVWWRGAWHPVTRQVSGGYSIPTWVGRTPPKSKPIHEDRVARLAGAFGRRSAQRLRNTHIGVVGAGGTGAPAIEVLARAGVGWLTVVDPDIVNHSNLERLHGAYLNDVDLQLTKVEIARNHVRAIDPDIQFEGLIGRLPQPRVVDSLMHCDVILGCTDQQHSRLALNELASRYLVPVIDIGVTLEGNEGTVGAQIIQVLHLTCDNACVICRGMVDWRRIGQELMSPDEQQRRRAAAIEARARGEDAHGYWRDIPQLNTVGYLTTAAASIGAGCAIGIVTGAFSSGFERAQWTLFTNPIDVLSWSDPPKDGCVCRRTRGIAGLSPQDQLVNCPSHWSEVRRIN